MVSKNYFNKYFKLDIFPNKAQKNKQINFIIRKKSERNKRI